MKVGGKLDEKRKTSCREKYGVDYVVQLDSTKARQRESMTEETVEKRQNTMLHRYGVKNALESPDIAEKIEKTCLERYGVDNPLKCREIQEKIDNVLIKRYGSRNALAAPGAIDKRRSTWIENYGVDCPIRLESVLEKKKSTCLKKYGVDNPMKLEEMKIKVHETKKANGTYRSQQSRPEKLFYSLLCSVFGEDDVEQHVIVNGWCIDMHVKSVDLYIQVDGVYYHGLDRPLNTIVESNKSLDKTILATRERDKRQNDWFEENGLRLFRITDKQILDDKQLTTAMQSIKKYYKKSKTDSE